MMLETLGDERNLCHESERLHERVEDQAAGAAMHRRAPTVERGDEVRKPRPGREGGDRPAGSSLRHETGSLRQRPVTEEGRRKDRLRFASDCLRLGVGPCA